MDHIERLQELAHHHLGILQTNDYARSLRESQAEYPHSSNPHSQTVLLSQRYITGSLGFQTIVPSTKLLPRDGFTPCLLSTKCLGQ